MIKQIAMVAILGLAIVLSAAVYTQSAFAANALAGQGYAAGMGSNINSQGKYCGNPSVTATGPPIPSCTANMPGTHCRP